MPAQRHAHAASDETWSGRLAFQGAPPERVLCRCVLHVWAAVQQVSFEPDDLAAGLTNVLWMRPGASVVQLTPYGWCAAHVMTCAGGCAGHGVLAMRGQTMPTTLLQLAEGGAVVGRSCAALCQTSAGNIVWVAWGR